MRELLLGNEAIALGALHAGCSVSAAYPGTPSTEINEAIAKLGDIYCEWAPNEKVALEVAIGASIAGARAFCAMKHVGLNVAADPLFTAAYTGVNGGLVITVADDPGLHSSQNEQDSRFYARSAHIPMFEPTDSQECYDFTRMAFRLSEEYDTPVLLRMTTRISHARSMVEMAAPQPPAVKPYEKNAGKYVMMPGMARQRHIAVVQREERLQKDIESMDFNAASGQGELGVICSGASYQYAKEALPDAAIFKLGMVYPLPIESIRAFAKTVKRLVVVEELEPFFETQIKAAGIEVEGKSLFSLCGELSTNRVAEKLGKLPETSPAKEVPGRPPVLCPGCPHRAVYYVLNKLGVTVTGDIGCYTLGAMPPLGSIDACICMGASVSAALGMEKARGKEFARKLVGVIGDSTFVHSGITGLVDMVYNGGTSTILILDNSTTGMTGHQDNPATGLTITGAPTHRLDLEAVCRAVGVEHVTTVDPFNLSELEKAVRQELEREQPSVIICRRPCALLDKSAKTPYMVQKDVCRNCKACMKLGCPAIENHGDFIRINSGLCNGCGLCQDVCPFSAITKEGEAQ